MPVLLTSVAALAGLAIGPALYVLGERLAAVRSYKQGSADRPDSSGPRPVRDSLRPVAALSIATAVLFAAMAARFRADPVLATYLYLAALGVTLVHVDVRVHRLPDALTLPSYPVVAGLLVVATTSGSSTGSLLRALLGGLAMWTLYLVLHLVSPRSLGFGDVKLAGVLGMCTGWLGWGVWAVGIAAGTVLSGLYAVGLLALRRGSRSSHFALGPFLVAGALTAALGGREIAAWYAGR